MRWKSSDKAPEPPDDKQVVGPAAHGRKKEVIINNIRLTTPLLGGGVESLKIDHGMLIRAASIRGHLRFWCGRSRTVLMLMNFGRKKKYSGGILKMRPK